MKLGSLAAVAATTLLVSGIASADNYLVIGNGNAKKVAAAIEAAGGTVVASYPFGVTVASADGADFNVPGMSVVADVGFDVETPPAEIELDAGFPPNSGDDDALFDLQWGHNYVGAQEAWMAGYRGQGVKVAVLDGGFDLDHPDLAPNINFALSADMTGEGLQYGLPDPFSHGSHVAGTIAAADNGIGTIGVAPDAELILVKVLGDSGSGSFGDVIAGIYYATSVGAHVMNMSLGALIPRQGLGGENADISALKNAVNSAITYAHQNGTTVVVSAGNEGHDLDGDKGAVRFNTGMSHAVGISAIAPQNWATFPEQSLNAASYTNYGTSMVDFAAPGGDYMYPGNELCTVAGITRPCWVLDFVFSTGNGTWYWSVGTSMASPHAAGVAALIISETGNSNPAHVIREMRKRATDGGKPGRDDIFGHGTANTGH